MNVDILTTPALLALGTVPVVILCFAIVYFLYGPGFLPPGGDDRQNGTAWLRHGIIVGFFYAALNAAFWGVKWALQLTDIELNGTPMYLVWAYWGGYADPFLKGFGGAYVAWAHLYGRYLAFSHMKNITPFGVFDKRFWLSRPSDTGE